MKEIMIRVKLRKSIKTDNSLEQLTFSSFTQIKRRKIHNLHKPLTKMQTINGSIKSNKQKIGRMVITSKKMSSITKFMRIKGAKKEIEEISTASLEIANSVMTATIITRAVVTRASSVQIKTLAKDHTKANKTIDKLFFVMHLMIKISSN